MPSFKPRIYRADFAVVHWLSRGVPVLQAVNMDNLLLKINISYFELAGFRHSETMAKHQEQQGIVTLPVI